MAKLKIKNRFGQTPNLLLNSKEASLKAKGLYGYIQAKPEDWNFSAKRISKEIKEGIDAVNKALNELEALGYLERVKFQNDKGHWLIEYHLHIDPIILDRKPLQREIPVTENPIQENPVQGKPLNKENNSIQNNYIQRNKEKEGKPSRSRFVKPTIEDIFSYMLEKGKEKSFAKKESEMFFYHYESNGWKVGGKSKMVSWKASVMTWINRHKNFNKLDQTKPKINKNRP